MCCMPILHPHHRCPRTLHAGYASAKPCNCGHAHADLATAAGRQHAEACSCIELSAQPQQWQLAAAASAPPTIGKPITIRSAHRTACASYIASTSARCSGDKVLLSSNASSNAARWVLYPSPYQSTFFVAFAGNSGCPRRWLGAPARCGGDRLQLYDSSDRGALLVWRLVPLA